VKVGAGTARSPSKDNAIYRLAGGLTRLARLEFPVTLSATTSAWFEKTDGIFSMESTVIARARRLLGSRWPSG
jgi:hypothetical protein